MGQSQSTLDAEEIQKLQQTSGFTASQIKRLYKRFQRLDKTQKGAITSEDFMQIPELAMNPLVSRIIRVFDKDNADSDDSEISVNFEQFVNTLSTFLPSKMQRQHHLTKAQIQEKEIERRQKKLEFVFQIYDLDGDNYIDANELFEVLKLMVTDNISEEGLGFIVEQTMNEASSDDGKISMEDFQKVLQHTDLESRMTIRF